MTDDDHAVLDIEEHIDELERRIDEIEQEAVNVELEMERVRDDLERADEEEREDLVEDAENLDQQWNKLNQQHAELTGKVAKFKETLYGEDGWEDGEFVVKENLTFGEVMRAKDEVARASYELDGQDALDGVPRDGFYRVKVLQLAIVESPAEAPSDPKFYPLHVGQWLYDKVDELNTMGDMEMGNSSLKEAVKERREESSSQNSSDTDTTLTESA